MVILIKDAPIGQTKLLTPALTPAEKIDADEQSKGRG